MKKIVKVLMVTGVLLALAACGSDAKKGSDTPDTDVSAQMTEPDREAQQPDSETPENEASENKAENPISEEASGDAEVNEGGHKALVVYFSATGNTKAVAETIAELNGADIYEIVPEEPYTEEDLNYHDSSTRATAEQNDPDARPAISGDLPDMEQYEVIYAGYPIWWGNMPRILYTFFDACDLTGKTIAPFCTSGSSGLSGTPETISGLEPGAVVLEGLSISGSAADDAKEDVAEWLADIGLD